jgi:hypothetical protein
MYVMFMILWIHREERGKTRRSHFPFSLQINMMTPSGRFQVNTKICMSMSDFHPEVSIMFYVPMDSSKVTNWLLYYMHSACLI